VPGATGAVNWEVEFDTARPDRRRQNLGPIRLYELLGRSTVLLRLLGASGRPT
jgi:hypothetical protein